MKLKDIDAIEAQPLETPFDGLGQMFGAGVVGPLHGPTALPSCFGGDHHSGRVGIERFGNQLLRNIGSVGVGGIDEVHTQFDSPAQSGQRRGLVCRGAPDALAGNPHGSVAEAVHCEVTTEGEGSRGCGRNGSGRIHATTP